jgi:hypothetical protein
MRTGVYLYAYVARKEAAVLWSYLQMLSHRISVIGHDKLNSIVVLYLM